VKWFRDIVIGLCSYEVVAIVTGRIPTLTALQKRYRVLGPVILTGLALHFYKVDVDAHIALRRSLRVDPATNLLTTEFAGRALTPVSRLRFSRFSR
jgi:hypothetical protein